MPSGRVGVRHEKTNRGIEPRLFRSGIAPCRAPQLASGLRSIMTPWRLPRFFPPTAGHLLF